MDIIEILLLALSLSVDSCVVSMSGSVTLGKPKPLKIFCVALVFGAMQASLLFIGWVLGHSVVSYLSRIAAWVGCVLLLYVGGSLLIPALRKGAKQTKANLNGFYNLLIAAVATSVDATAVGVSLAMTEISITDMVLTVISVFLVTMAASATGVVGGCALGRKIGRPAKIAGGIVLIAIGISLLF